MTSPYNVPEDAKFRPIPPEKVGKKKASKTACHKCNCCRVYSAAMAFNLKRLSEEQYRRGYRNGERAALKSKEGKQSNG